MSARIRAIEVLPERDRVLVEARNKTVYAAEVSRELRDLSSWLDRELYNKNHPSAPPGSRLNDARYGPTLQFLFSQSAKSDQPPFEIVVREMARWAKSRSSRAAGILDPAFVRQFSKCSKNLVATGDPLEPIASPDGAVRLRVNDFPDEPLWTLQQQGRKAIQFDDWPSAWHRPKTVAAQARGKCDRIWYYAMEQYQENHESELRNQDHMCKRLELIRDMLNARGLPFSATAGLALRRWHWRVENRRQVIEELGHAEREFLAKRARSVLGGPFRARSQILQFALVDNDYEHYFGIRWGDISPERVMRLKGVVQSEGIEYGPTIGYFYAKAAKSGGERDGAIAMLKQWAEQEPASYQEFLRQKASVVPDYGSTPALENWFGRQLIWATTDNFDAFYKTATKSDDGKRMKLAVRINDFPDERLFSLFENGAWVGDFNDWPLAWMRS